LKNSPFILRASGLEFIEGTNGGVVEIIVDFPFMLSLVEAFIGFSANQFFSVDPITKRTLKLTAYRAPFS
jgi:hypothetical protein